MKIPERKKSAWKLTFLGKLIQLSVFMIIYLNFFGYSYFTVEGDMRRRNVDKMRTGGGTREYITSIIINFAL